MGLQGIGRVDFADFLHPGLVRRKVLSLVQHRTVMSGENRPVVYEGRQADVSPANIALRKSSSRARISSTSFISVPLLKDQEPLAMRAQCVLGDSRHLARSLEHA